MRPIALTQRKIRIKRNLASYGVILVLALIVIGGYFLAVKKGLPQINLAALVSYFAKEKTATVENEEALPDIKIETGAPKAETQAPKIYEEVAEAGEGITHLARKALKAYLTEKGGPTLSPEHKIFIEDYLQKKTGERWLQIGEKITFSQELIEEAIQKAQQLTPEQLENLSQFAKLVPELNY